jgi:putative transcriptional regulator
MNRRNIGDEILQGLIEIKEWQAGHKKLKTTQIKTPAATDVSVIRHHLGLTQEVFATFMGVSVATLRNWEQGRREPQGSAKSLLMIAEKAPEAFIKTFHIENRTQ